MSYPSNLSEEKINLIRPFLDAIMALEEGQSYLITHQDVGRIRGILYEWRHINGLKKRFKIISEDPVRITILCRNSAPPITLLQDHHEPEEIVRAQQYVWNNLVEVIVEKEALSLITRNLPPELISTAYKEWKRING